VDVWAFNFPVTPQIDAGERRERLPSTGGVFTCSTCGGGGGTVACARCEGQGSEICGRCRGTERVTCATCRGRGRVARVGQAAPDTASPMHRHAERLASEAGERIIEFAERLREDLGLHHHMPDWLGTRAVSGDTMLCPDCDGGKQPCDCQGGRRPCATCDGSGRTECGACKGTGGVVRFREIVRRFDTRVSHRTVPLAGEHARWVPEDVLARGAVEPAWQGSVSDLAADQPPDGIPREMWDEALAFASIARAQQQATSGNGDGAARRVLSTVVSLVRVPLVRLEYSFGDTPYVVVAFGASGRERFWAESFPHRWSRITRFMRAVSRDLGEPVDLLPAGQVSDLGEHRARRAAAPAPADGDADADGPEPDAGTSPTVS
jgi:hypothetical protein